MPKVRRIPRGKKADPHPIVAALPAACSDEALAVEFMEKQRWGDSPACPRCGVTNPTQVKGKDGKRHPRFLWRCGGCKQQFTVRIGTILEDSRIPVRHWCYAFWAACAGKKGVSALQIHRQTSLSYKSSLFLMHRIRYAMTPNDPDPPKLSGIVEVDETYIGGKPRKPTRYEWKKARSEAKKLGRYRIAERGPREKPPVVAFIERGGRARAVVVPEGVTASKMRYLLLTHVDRSATLMTDESTVYLSVGWPYAAHGTTAHSKREYARGEVHSNSAESFFARLKRQLYGTHHAVSRKHLHRYVSEVEFKHNTRLMEDGERVIAAIGCAEGKRLFYRQQLAG